MEEGPRPPLEPENKEKLEFDFLAFPSGDGTLTVKRGCIRYLNHTWFSEDLKDLPYFKEDGKTIMRYLIKFDENNIGNRFYALDPFKKGWIPCRILGEPPGNIISLKKLESDNEEYNRLLKRHPELVRRSRMGRNDILKESRDNSTRAMKRRAQNEWSREVHARLSPSLNEVGEAESDKQDVPIVKYRDDLARGIDPTFLDQEE